METEHHSQDEESIESVTEVALEMGKVGEDDSVHLTHIIREVFMEVLLNPDPV